MKNTSFGLLFKKNLAGALLVLSLGIQAQTPSASTTDFWNRVQFGGGLGLGIGSGYTDVTVAPGAIYNFNPYVALGVGLQGSYVRVKHNYESYIYGGSLLGLFNPVEQVQLSAELEQLRVNTTFDGYYTDDYPNRRSPLKDNFWNTALYLGAGYRVQNVTVGLRYNVLFDDDKSVYSEAFMPFVRAYF